jgi:flagellar motor protein MotB
LSLARAVAVAELMRAAMGPEVYFLIKVRGDDHMLAPTLSRRARGDNRRAEIILDA